MLKLTEPETKWDVDNRFMLPDLNDLASDGHVEHATIDTVSSYYDTSDADLQASGILLRCRDGDETGWELTLEPGGDALHWPLSDLPPAEALSLLTGVTGGKALHHIGTIHTVRQRHRINAASSDALIAEIAEDEVRASNGDRLLAWKEIGVELGPAADRTPKQIKRLLEKAGATPARYPSKLAHLAGITLSAPPAAPAVQALTGYVDDQVEAIVAGDIALRRGRDAIHDTRVATRRLRSTLRIFTPLFQADALNLEDELKWYAALLGEVRDCQVQHARFIEALDSLPDELTLGPVRSRLRADLQAIELPARTQVATEMDSPRYLAMLETVRSWHGTAPLVGNVTEKEVLRLASKAGRKADRRLTEAVRATGAHQAELLHRARKGAKRARYAAELTAELPDPGKAKRTVKHYKQIQSVLGDHQDTVVAREMLRRMGAAAGSTPGENGFAFGMLYAQEEALADARLTGVLQLSTAKR